MNPGSGLPHLRIKKYSNRRFYDATNSRHLTLADMHDLIVEGHDLTITDSATGDDITNIVLTQIILERDAPKLAIFPANILHQVIRTQQQFLGTVVENYFRQVLQAQKASQERWADFLTNTLGMPLAPGSPFPVNPLEWGKAFLGKQAGTDESAREPEPAPEPPPPHDEEPADRDEQLRKMKREIEALQRRIGGLGKKPKRRKRT